MDYDKIMEIFDAALSFLTKLLIGVGALDADKEPPYKPYLDDATLHFPNSLCISLLNSPFKTLPILKSSFPTN